MHRIAVLFALVAACPIYADPIPACVNVITGAIRAVAKPTDCFPIFEKKFVLESDASSVGTIFTGSVFATNYTSGVPVYAYPGKKDLNEPVEPQNVDFNLYDMLLPLSGCTASGLLVQLTDPRGWQSDNPLAVGLALDRQPTALSCSFSRGQTQCNSATKTAALPGGKKVALRMQTQQGTMCCPQFDFVWMCK